MGDTGEGIDQLRSVLAGKSSILVGQSGIGKSSLINLPIPNLNTRVRELVRVANIGSHTTSNTRLHHLPPLCGATSPTAPAEQEPDDNDEPHVRDNDEPDENDESD